MTNSRRPSIARRVLTIITGIAAVAMMTVACSTSESDEAQSATPQQGGTLTFGEQSATLTFDPARVAGKYLGGSTLAALYGTLTRFDATEGKFVPYLAESLTPSSDFSQWTLELRPDMFFSNNEPYDADAVVSNVKRNMNPAVRSFAAPNFNLVADVVGEGPTTVKITLREGYDNFPAAFAGNGGWMAAPSYLAELDGGNASAQPIGAGPFTLSSFKPKEEILMVKNTKFILGEPHLDMVRFVPIAGGPTMLQSLQTGGVHVAQISDFPTQKQADDLGLDSFKEMIPGGSALVLNTREGSPTNDLRLRQALAMAVDTKFFNSRVNQGLGTGSNALVPGLAGAPHDSDAAKALVAAVKADTGWNGSLKLVCTNSPNQQAIPTALRALLEPIGINLDVNNGIDGNGLITAVSVKKEFDLACWSTPFEVETPYTSAFNVGFSKSPANQSGLNEPKMDAAIHALLVTSSETEREQSIENFNDMFNELAPAVVLAENNFATYYPARVHGIVPSSGATVLLDQAFLTN